MTKEEAKSLIPSKFKFACQTYTTKISDKGDVFGQFDSIRNEIELFLAIKDDYGNYIDVTKEQFMATYWHELGHCFNFVWNTDMDEDFAQMFSNFMMEYTDSKI